MCHTDVDLDSLYYFPTSFSIWEYVFLVLPLVYHYIYAGVKVRRFDVIKPSNNINN